MASFVQSDKYGSMNTTYSKTIGYYMINCFSEDYTIKEDTTCDGQISTSCEMVVIAHYLRCMQENTKCYWEENNIQQLIVVPTHIIVHTCPDVFVAKYFHDITRSAFNINQTRKDLQRHLICLTDSDNDYILDEIGGRDKIEYKINVSVENER